MTRRLPGMLVVVSVLALGGLGACGGGSSKSCPAKVETKTATGGAITVCAADTHFDVNTIKASPGPLTITLVNNGAAEHTLEIKDTSLDLTTPSGKTVKGTVTLSKGTYKFVCTVPGHEAAGMKGTIVVG